MELKEIKDRIAVAKGNAFTTEEILNIPPETLYKLSEKELRKVAGILVSSSNKRVRRLLRAVPKGISDAALRGSGVIAKPYGETDEDEVDVRFFSIKDKVTRNQVVREIRRMINFMEKKTSTVKGAVERRKENERLVFGETREERAKREKDEAKRIANLMKSGKTLEEAKEIIIAERDEELKGQAVITPEDIEKMGMTYDEILKEVFKYYRKFEEAHQTIIKEMGSDQIIRMVGQFMQANAADIHTQDDLDEALQRVEKKIIGAWEETDDIDEQDFFDQMEAYAKGETTEKPHFRAADGWR